MITNLLMYQGKALALLFSGTGHLTFSGLLPVPGRLAREGTVPSMTEPLHRSLGLTDDEAAEIERILGRTPEKIELAMYAVMWSEHCSYKSSRIHLGRLPSEGERVLVGPGENAGV